jgi:hypothetical protein
MQPLHMAFQLGLFLTAPHHSRREDFTPHGARHCNKSAAGFRPHGGYVAFFRPISTASIRVPIPWFAAVAVGGKDAAVVSAAGIMDMRSFHSLLLRSSRSRLGRRLAEIVAIAAASLPAAGA